MSPPSQAEFESLVAAALDGLPAWVHQRMDNVEVLTEDEPPDGQLLGLYEGLPLTERGSDYFGALPDRITLFRGPIAREARATGAPLAEVVERTVRHEVAHHFGIEDDRLLELDAY